jgi:hypothetical protein
MESVITASRLEKQFRNSFELGRNFLNGDAEKDIKWELSRGEITTSPVRFVGNQSNMTKRYPTA